MIDTMIELSKISHRHGLLKMTHIKTDSKVLKRACNLLAEAASEQVIRNTLQNEIDSLVALAHFAAQDVFKKMANYAPAFGMLGTLIGLIQMLSQPRRPCINRPIHGRCIINYLLWIAARYHGFFCRSQENYALEHLQKSPIWKLFERVVSVY